ncbi:hypothetical protein [Rugosimonospora africana]|uniref:DUF4034 domain-containing protein n=1 Tax=Rugosimonospora africana TaxID=556532 RepID=A0A8J3QRT2_9ACTN|nr:hypothetical protein [Rugosimonospora africana]GIH15092.1 hypothetical protein Raf01_32640 [Rugosimonospora africana]
MSALYLLIPVAVAALWFVVRYRDGSLRRAWKRPAPDAPRQAPPAPAAEEPVWEFRPENYGLVPDDQVNTDLAGPDPHLVDALRAASSGDWRPASALLAGSDPEWRWIRLVSLAKAAAEDDSWLRTWRGTRPDDPGAALVAAQSLIELAWKLRGAKQAEHTDQEQFENFHRVLAQAPSALAEAARIAPAEPAPYLGMMSVALGEGWPHERMAALWGEVVARAPEHVGAHVVALQYWCAKWRGSHALMYEFAEAAAAQAQPGSLLPMLRLAAIYEELIGQRSDHPGYHSPATTAAIDALLVDVRACPPEHAWLPAARHLLVWFLWAQRRLPEAAEQLRLVDGYIGALPWKYHSNPVKLYSPVRTHITLHVARMARESA